MLSLFIFRWIKGPVHHGMPVLETIWCLDVNVSEQSTVGREVAGCIVGYMSAAMITLAVNATTTVSLPQQDSHLKLETPLQW